MARVTGGDGPALARPHGKRRTPRRWRMRLLVLTVFLSLGTGIAARLTFTLIPPHEVLPSLATLSAEKRAQLDEALEVERPLDREQAIDFALQFTGQSLSLSPGQSPSFDFDVGARRGGAAQYTALFAVVFDAAAKKAGSTARAVRVRSQVRVFGKRVPLPAFDSHDWSLVRDPADGARIYLDPTLADAWLGATLARNVKGGAAIDLPK
jgi:hypothetical protein